MYGGSAFLVRMNIFIDFTSRVDIELFVSFFGEKNFLLACRFVCVVSMLVGRTFQRTVSGDVRISGILFQVCMYVCMDM